MIYYKHYMGDYQRDTGHLSLAQDGAYRRMMDHYYSTEQPLPAASDVLYRICGAIEKKEREAVDYVSKQFFKEINGRLHHQRIDEEVSIAQEKIANLKENAKAGGKQSGKTRASKNEANGEANASPNGVSKNEHKSVSNNQTKPDGLEKPKAQLAVALPVWLPQDVWDQWVAYRKSIKAPLTQRAAELCIAKLAELKGQGNDPCKVIDQSIMSCKWTGLFAVKEAQQARASPYQAKQENAQKLIDRISGKPNDTPEFIDLN